MRAPFIIFHRDKKNKTYYAAFWNSDLQKYDAWKSTGSLKGQLGKRADHLSPTSKAGARTIVQMWIDSGAVQKNDLKLIDYLEGFWLEDSEYVQRRAARKALSREYIAGNAGAIKRVREFLTDSGRADLLLRQTDAGTLENMIDHLRAIDGLSARRVNAIFQAVAVPLAEAVRTGKLIDNPAATIQKLTEQSVEREPLTPDEVRSFFSMEWNDNRHRVMNLLAATTGMRLGECRGLLIEDVHDDWIYIRNNWIDGEGNKLPKGGKVRSVPIPAKTAEALRGLIAENAWNNDFVFYGSSKERPIGKRMVALVFKEALRTIGICESEIKRRKITFHSWRHWYNSMLRGKVDDHALRRLTGHSSEGMTERYTEITPEQRSAVAALAENLVND